MYLGCSHLINIEKIRERTQDRDILDFAEFVLAETGNRNFPDYKKMDLMKIARLVARIWVLDFKNGLEDGLIFHFSGTKIDSHFDRNITGLDFEKIYTGEHYEKLIHQSYHQVYLQKRPCYTRRLDYYSDKFIDKHPSVETVLFPCSSNDDDINFGLGMTKFTTSEIEHLPEFLLL